MVDIRRSPFSDRTTIVGNRLSKGITISQFIRIRRLHRTPLRIGTISVSNAREGSLVDVDNPKVQRDMKNAYDRWIFVDRLANVGGSNFPTVQTIVLTGNTGTRSFNLTYEGTECVAGPFVRGTNQTAAAIQAGLRTLTNDGALTVTGTTDGGTTGATPFVVTFATVLTPSLLSVTSPSVAALSGVVTSNAVAAPVHNVNNMSVLDATVAITGANIFGGATGSSEFAWAVNLPANYTVKTVTVWVVTAGGAATTHNWLTIATYDGVKQLTYQAATADVATGTIAAGPRVYSPVVSGSTSYVTPFEGQYIFTMTEATGSSTVATLAGANVLPVNLASRLARAIPQNVNTYGNPGAYTLYNPFAAGLGQAVTTPPAVASTNVAQNFTPTGFIPYTEVSGS